MYATYDFYNGIFGDKAMPETQYARCAYSADKTIDRYTTGVDNVRKLKIAFPSDLDAIEAVQRLAAELAHFFYEADRFGVGEDGSVHGAVTSVSSGSESITYATQNTAFSAAVADVKVRSEYLRNMVREYLSGVSDANGVNLLYMGVYPYVS